MTVNFFIKKLSMADAMINLQKSLIDKSSVCTDYAECVKSGRL